MQVTSIFFFFQQSFLSFNSFSTIDDTRGFCGQCRSRSDRTIRTVWSLIYNIHIFILYYNWTVSSSWSGIVFSADKNTIYLFGNKRVKIQKKIMVWVIFNYVVCKSFQFRHAEMLPFDKGINCCLRLYQRWVLSLSIVFTRVMWESSQRLGNNFVRSTGKKNSRKAWIDALVAAI